VDPGEAREAAERPVTVRLYAPSSRGYEALEDFLSPRSVSPGKRLEVAGQLYRADDPGIPEQIDLEIIAGGAEPQTQTDGWFVFDAERPAALVKDVLAAREELGLALSRSFPPFRRPVIDRVIHSIARENTVFTLMTSLPALAPTLSLPIQVPDISDTAFVTVNQIRMAFLLAAASDRPVGYREQRAEVAALIAGAFGWRGLARWLGERYSWGDRVMPRAALAYAGTYVVGRSLERLYRTGYGMTREERRLAYGDALARGQQVAHALMEAWRDRQSGRRTGQASRR
jgi:hypothetical protein